MLEHIFCVLKTQRLCSPREHCQKELVMLACFQRGCFSQRHKLSKNIAMISVTGCFSKRHKLSNNNGGDSMVSDK